MAIVIMVAVIIEATTVNAELIMPVLHTANLVTTTANPATTTANHTAKPATTTANHTANPAATMENLMAKPATTTAKPKLEKIIPLMVIPRSFPR